jgi:hypothetical protein
VDSDDHNLIYSHWVVKTHKTSEHHIVPVHVGANILAHSKVNKDRMMTPDVDKRYNYTDTDSCFINNYRYQCHP